MILAKSLADVVKQITIENIEILAVSPEHILQISTLPFHHRDPFDRMIVSQAVVENMDFVSADAVFDQYFQGLPTKRIW